MAKYIVENGTCVGCGVKGVCDLHHLKTRAAGGTDEPHNLLMVCRICHTKIHGKGLKWFSDKYPKAATILRYNKWKFDGFMNKWMRLTEEGWDE